MIFFLSKNTNNLSLASTKGRHTHSGHLSAIIRSVCQGLGWYKHTRFESELMVYSHFPSINIYTQVKSDVKIYAEENKIIPK